MRSPSGQAGREGQAVLVTGAARRIGAEIARRLHADGFNLLLHYRNSRDEALHLAAEFNRVRAGSAETIQADLGCEAALRRLAEQANQFHGGVDVLVNNASLFYPTVADAESSGSWQEIMDCNLKAPYFLCTHLAPGLASRHGCIVNIVDIHGQRPLKYYPIYSISQAGLIMLTQSLAREFAPDIRVNGIAPGAILWPEQPMTDSTCDDILSRIPLARPGNPADIAAAVHFLIRDADYITGQILPIDGGRSLSY